MAESSQQGTVDKIMNELKADNKEQSKVEVKTEIKVANSGKVEVKEMCVAHLTCIYCGLETNMIYGKDEKPITGYMPTRRSWRGKECINDCGHAFILREKFNERYKNKKKGDETS